MNTLLQALVVLLLSSVAFCYTGEITYFGHNYYDLWHVACESGYPPRDANLYAAISYKILSDQSSILNSGQCGRCLQLWSPKGSVKVTIVDVMMDDVNPYNVDLSYEAFVRLSDTKGRDFDIKWDYVDCDGWAASPSPEPLPSPSPETLPSPSPSPQPSPEGTTDPSPVSESVKNKDSLPVPAPNSLPTPDSITTGVFSTSTVATTASVATVAKSTSSASTIASFCLLTATIVSFLLF
ncbi:hypothetical protein BDR26DRAFT_890970 [Obelidium mucronatum]|nr:hypothetical protein BDR26DRAFT_890970 [Obelidium mucronatum]